MKRKWTVMAIGATALLLGAAVAVATPGAGILEAPVLGRGSFSDDVGIKFMVKGNGGAEIVNAKDPSQALVQKIVIAPGGHTGWHTHPGPVVVVVASGALTYYRADDPTCTGITYPAGCAFVDPGRGHVHIARNLSTTQNLELYATYFEVPPGAGTQRIDAADPGHCPFYIGSRFQVVNPSGAVGRNGHYSTVWPTAWARSTMTPAPQPWPRKPWLTDRGVPVPSARDPATAGTRGCKRSGRDPGRPLLS